MCFQNAAIVNHSAVAYKVIFISLIYHGSMLAEAYYDPISLSHISWAYLVYSLFFFLFVDFITFSQCFLYWLSLFILISSCSITTLVHNCRLFLTERVLISANARSRNGKYTDLCQYFLTVSEGRLFRFTCCSNERDHFSSTQNSSAKLTASAYTDWNSSSAFSRVSLEMWMISSIFINQNYSVDE